MPELLKNPFERLGQSIRSYCPATRWIAAGFAILVATSLVWLICGGAGGLTVQRELLFSGQKFSDSELISMESAFAQAHLNDYRVADNSIDIPAAKRMEYIVALANAKSLPRNFNQRLDEIVGEISLFDAPATRDLKLKIGRQKALAEIINSIDGLSQAAVLWDVEKTGGLSPKTIVRASVTLRTNPGIDLSDQQVLGIRQMVAHAVAGLEPGNVAVSDTRTGICYAQEVPPPALVMAPLNAERSQGERGASFFPSPNPILLPQSCELSKSPESSGLSESSAASKTSQLLKTGGDAVFAGFAANTPDSSRLFAPASFGANNPINPVQDPDCRRRLQAEAFWNHKIQQLLSVYISGAIVQSTVEFAEFQSQLEKRVEHDTQPTIYRSVLEENTDRTLADSQQSQGTADSADSIANSRLTDSTQSVAFGVNQPRSLEQRDSMATVTSTVRKTEDGILGGRVTVTQKDPAAQIRVCATIIIPQQYLIQVCRYQFQLSGEQIPSRSQIDQTGAAQVQSLLKLIGTILPQKEGRERPEDYLHIVFTDISSVNNPSRLVAENRPTGIVPLYEQNGYLGNNTSSQPAQTNVVLSADPKSADLKTNDLKSNDLKPAVAKNETTAKGETKQESALQDLNPVTAAISPSSLTEPANDNPNEAEDHGDAQSGQLLSLSVATNDNPEIESETKANTETQSDLQTGSHSRADSESAPNNAVAPLRSKAQNLVSNAPIDEPRQETAVDSTDDHRTVSSRNKTQNQTASVSPASPALTFWPPLYWKNSADWRQSAFWFRPPFLIGFAIVAFGLILLLLVFRRSRSAHRNKKRGRIASSDATIDLLSTVSPDDKRDESPTPAGDPSAPSDNATMDDVPGAASDDSGKRPEINPALELLNKSTDLDEYPDDRSRNPGDIASTGPSAETTEPTPAALESKTDVSSAAVPVAAAVRPLGFPKPEESRESEESAKPEKSYNPKNSQPQTARFDFSHNVDASTDSENGPNCDFSLLESVSSLRIAQILSVERPQTAALALSQLSEEKAGEVLAGFSSDYRSEVVQRLLRLENTDPEILAALAVSMAERAKTFVDGDENPAHLDCRSNTKGKERLSRILAASDLNVGRQILSSLKQVDQELIAEWTPEHFKFDDLTKLDAMSLQTLYEAADPNEFQIALVGAPVSFLNQIVSLLPGAIGRQLKEDIWKIGPTRLSDVEEARRRIVQLTCELVIQGHIQFNQPCSQAV